jgi:hypothetical protein
LNYKVIYNLKNAVIRTYPNYSIEYAQALVSRGSLAGALNATAASTVVGQVAFGFHLNRFILMRFFFLIAFFCRL